MTRHWLEDSHDVVPYEDMRRLEQTTVDMQRVAPGLWECAAGGMNQPRRTYSRAPVWHGPNGYAGCTGDTLALPGRRADAGAEPGGSAAALAARQAVGRIAVGWEGELYQAQVVVGAHCSAVAVVAAEKDEAPKDVAVAAVQQAAAVLQDGVEGGVALVSSKVVADGDHQAVGRKVDEI